MFLLSANWLTMLGLNVLVWTFVLFIQTSYCVDRGNFKTCDDSSFCKRQRVFAPGDSKYVVVPSSVDVSNDKLSAQLTNSANGVNFLLDVFGLENNMLRMRVVEKDPLKPRYEPPVGDVLLAEPKTTPLKKVEENGSGVSLEASDAVALYLQFDPFRLDVIEHGEPVIVVNSRNLMNFEHTRTKEESPKTEEPSEPTQEGEATEETTPSPAPSESAGMWEENFRSHEDSKPNGPQSIGMDFSFPGFEHVYGIPEHADTLALKSTKQGDPYRVYNLDTAEYELYNPMALYGSVPFLITHRQTDPYRVYNLDTGEYELHNPMALYGSVPLMIAHRQTDPYRIYNLDAAEYEIHNPMALYGSIPLMFAQSVKRTVGIFWLNTAEMWVDIANSVTDRSLFSKMVNFMKRSDELPQIDTHWFVETGIVDVFFLLGPKPKQLFAQYASLTGTTPLPPLFGLAYHQSRWNYNDQEDVKNVDAGFDQHDIPFDVIWLDIEHTDGKRYFTWDKSKFPEPHDMVSNLAAKGRKLVTIVDPHIKQDTGYEVHEESKQGDYFVKDKNGNDYDGWCWPGSSHWLDFTNPTVRNYWADQYDYNDYEGSSMHLHVWNDMNEPSVLNGPEVTMHKDAKHFGGWEHRAVHNIYGMYCQMATYQGLLKRSNYEQRPFVLSRAFFAGAQRYGAVWTGDNTAEWSHLQISLPMVLTLNIAGITFSGADVGGFFKNPDPELITRWYQAGVLYPFFRAHAHLDTKRREPWLLPAENMHIVRDAIRFRYKLLPYWYTLFFESEQSGMPLMRPIWVNFPEVDSTFSVENTFMIGDALLAAPVVSQGASSVSVYFPPGLWYDVETYQVHHGHSGGEQSVPVTLSKIPVFQRGGTIVPHKERVRRASILSRQDPFTLVVCLDQSGSAVGTLYSDDYHTFKYRDAKSYVYRNFTYSSGVFSSLNLNPEGQYDTMEWIERIIIAGFDRQPSRAVLTRQSKDAGESTTILDTAFESSHNLLIIRKPGVNVNTDFTITLS